MPFGVARDWERLALPKPEILSYPLETTVIDSAVINATGVTADSSGPYTGRRYLLAGTILSKREDNQYERFTAAGAATEVQVVTVTNGANPFTLTFEGQTTASIAGNATAAAVEAALEALSNLAPADVGVAGSDGGPYTVTFAGAWASKSITQMTGTNATVTTSVQGVKGQAVAGILFDTIEFADQSDASDEPVAFLRRNVSFQATKIIDYATHEVALKAALTTCEFV